MSDWMADVGRGNALQGITGAQQFVQGQEDREYAIKKQQQDQALSERSIRMKDYEIADKARAEAARKKIIPLDHLVGDPLFSPMIEIGKKMGYATEKDGRIWTTMGDFEDFNKYMSQDVNMRKQALVQMSHGVLQKKQALDKQIQEAGNNPKALEPLLQQKKQLEAVDSNILQGISMTDEDLMKERVKGQVKNQQQEEQDRRFQARGGYSPQPITDAGGQVLGHAMRGPDGKTEFIKNDDKKLLPNTLHEYEREAETNPDPILRKKYRIIADKIRSGEIEVNKAKQGDKVFAPESSKTPTISPYTDQDGNPLMFNPNTGELAPAGMPEGVKAKPRTTGRETSMDKFVKAFGPKGGNSQVNTRIQQGVKFLSQAKDENDMRERIKVLRDKSKFTQEESKQAYELATAKR